MIPGKKEQECLLGLFVLFIEHFKGKDLHENASTQIFTSSIIKIYIYIIIGGETVYFREPWQISGLPLIPQFRIQDSLSMVINR